MKLLIEKIVFLILCFGITTALSAQTKKEAKKTEAKQVHVDLIDGNSIEGKLITRRGDTVVVESTTLGVLNLNIKNIKNIKNILFWSACPRQTGSEKNSHAMMPGIHTRFSRHKNKIRK